jgi:hypothetical protein
MIISSNIEWTENLCTSCLACKPVDTRILITRACVNRAGYEH